MKLREKKNFFAVRGQGMAEYALVLFACVIAIIVAVNTLQPGLQKFYKKSNTYRAGYKGMAP